MTQTIYKCIGIGTGPSNLSLAALLQPFKGHVNIFFEQKPEFSWHDGMYFTGASLQVALFKDLVTLANPTSEYSFVSYLHDQGKIYQFLNARFPSVPRKEFGKYLYWASSKMPNLNFGETVLDVEFNDHFVVTTDKRRVVAENIAVGVGIVPYVPAFARDQQCGSQFHVNQYCTQERDLTDRRVVIIGGGQSGAEAFLQALSPPDGGLPRQVTWVSKRENFSPLDDSPFTNDYFMPCHSDFFFECDSEFRTAFIKRNILASDGISEATLQQIYQQLYTLRFIDERHGIAALLPGRTVDRVRHDGRQWVLEARHEISGADEVVTADVVVWATGFRPAPMEFLAPLMSRFELEDEEIRVDASFAALWDGPPNRGIFLMNTARGQRGLPDPNLSLLAWRSQRVVERLLGPSVARSPQIPSFVTWSSTAPSDFGRRRVV